MKLYRAILITMMLLLPQQVSSTSAENVVLVTGLSTEIGQLDKKSLRKLYLGIPVTLNNHRLIPVINQTDQDIYQGFLQHVMFMSDRKYQRMTVSRIYRKGGTQPSKVINNSELVQKLSQATNNISYMRYQDASQYSELKVLQILW